VAGAAAALALALGYAAALLGEIRRPRLADPSEAERITRVRVLAVIRPDEDVTPERARRRADTRALPFVDPAVEGYRLVYLSLVATGGAASRVAVTAAEPGVAAAVALNLAVAAAEDGRSTLVVDADARHATTTAALGLRGRPGLADAVRGAPVAPLVATVPVGRGAALHALPAGRPPAAAPAGRPAGAGAAVPVAADPRADLARVARSYDLTVTSLPPVPAGTAAALPAADGGPPRPAASPPAPETVAREVLAREVIVCARAGHTPLAGLTREIARLNGLGAQVRGLVIWDDDPPALPV
jgi:Mrp family chromosome partitioning ATPase